MIQKYNKLISYFTPKDFMGTVRLLWLIIFIPGIIGFLIKMISGERLTGYGSYVPWGLWIAVYFHAVGISGGSFAAGVIGYLRGIKGLRENLTTTLILSGVSLVTGLLAIWLDLGRPYRAYRVGLSPNFGSMLAFNAWMYVIFLGLVACLLFLIIHKRPEGKINDSTGWLVPLLLLGTILSVAYPSQSGAFFGVVDAKPFWSSAILPVLFLTSAIISGTSALLLVQYWLNRQQGVLAHVDENPFLYLRKIILVAIIIYAIAEFSEYSLALWSPVSHLKETIYLIMFGKFWWVFWVVHVCGTVAGFYLIFKPQSLHHLATGALVIVISFISTRLNIVIPGQSIPELKGLNEAFTHARLNFHYVPTLIEYLIVMFIVGFGLAAFYISLQLVEYYIHFQNQKGR